MYDPELPREGDIVECRHRLAAGQQFQPTTLGLQARIHMCTQEREDEDWRRQAHLASIAGSRLISVDYKVSLRRHYSDVTQGKTR